MKQPKVPRKGHPNPRKGKSKYDFLLAMQLGEYYEFDNMPTASEGRRKVPATNRKAYYRITSAVSLLQRANPKYTMGTSVITSAGSRIYGDRVRVTMLKLPHHDPACLVHAREVLPMTNETQTAAPVSLEALEQKIRGLAGVIRKYGTCAPAALDHCADALATLRLAQSGAVAEVREVCGFEHMVWTGSAYPVGTKLFTHPAAVADEAATLREALRYCVSQVPELGTVPGVAAALQPAPQEAPHWGNLPDDFDAPQEAAPVKNWPPMGRNPTPPPAPQKAVTVTGDGPPKGWRPCKRGTQCTRTPDCICGGSGWRAKCNSRDCAEYGCDGGRFCYVSRAEVDAELKKQCASTPADESEWANDAREYGRALNEAAWTFVNECPEKSVLLFNNTKAPLRAAILKYAEIVAPCLAAATPPTVAEDAARYRKVAKEYNDLILHMNAGGDFFEFQRDAAMKGDKA